MLNSMIITISTNSTNFIVRHPPSRFPPCYENALRVHINLPTCCHYKQKTKPYFLPESSRLLFLPCSPHQAMMARKGKQNRCHHHENGQAPLRLLRHRLVEALPPSSTPAPAPPQPLLS